MIYCLINYVMRVKYRTNHLAKISNIKKLGDYIVGNLNINQGPFGSRLYSLDFIHKSL